MAIEKKPGLYWMPWFGSKERIDVYWDDEGQRFFWGRNSDCGNPMTDDIWETLEYIGPTTGAYLDEMHGLMMCQAMDDGPDLTGGLELVTKEVPMKYDADGPIYPEVLLNTSRPMAERMTAIGRWLERKRGKSLGEEAWCLLDDLLGMGAEAIPFGLLFPDEPDIPLCQYRERRLLDT